MDRKVIESGDETNISLACGSAVQNIFSEKKWAVDCSFYDLLCDGEFKSTSQGITPAIRPHVTIAWLCLALQNVAPLLFTIYFKCSK